MLVKVDGLTPVRSKEAEDLLVNTCEDIVVAGIERLFLYLERKETLVRQGALNSQLSRQGDFDVFILTRT